MSKQVKGTASRTSTLINHLNAIYKLSKLEQQLSFKAYATDVDKSKSRTVIGVVDVTHAPGIKQFTKAVTDLKALAKNSKKLVKEGEDAKHDEDEEMKFNWSNVKQLIFNSSLRGFLDMADQQWISNNNNFFDEAINSIGLPEQKQLTLDDFFKAVTGYFKDDDKFKLKVFNKTFPHGVHNPEKEAKNVNIKYLQRLCRFHDELLPFIVEQLDADDEDVRVHVIERAHQLFVDAFSKEHKSPDEQQFITYLKCLPQLLPEFNDFAGNFKSDAASLKRVRELPQIKVVKGKVIPATETLEAGKDATKALIGYIMDMLSDIHGCVKFVDAVVDGKQRVQGVDLGACLKNYTKSLEELKQFVDAHANVDKTVKGLVKYLIEGLRFVAYIKGAPEDKKVLSFAEFNDDDVTFKLNSKVSKAISPFLFDKTADLDEVIEKAFEDVKDEDDISLIGVTTSVVTSNTSLYAKIGTLTPIEDVPKHIRVAVGLYIVQYVQHEIEKIQACTLKRKTGIIMIK